MKEIEVINKSINSVSQMRNVLFLPYNKIKNTNVYKKFMSGKKEVVLFENEHYKLQVMDHLLLQIHRDILDIVLNDKIIPFEGNRAYTSFSINSLLIKLNLNNGTTDRKWIEKRLEELKRTNIKIFSKKTIFSGSRLFSICDLAQHSEKINKYVLVFSSTYLSLLSEDILIDYSNYLPHILKIKNDTIKAFIRYIISNDWVNDTLDNILFQIEIKSEDMSNRNYQKIKKSIREFDFSDFCITITNNTVKYKKQEDIFFYNAQKELKKRTNIPIKTQQYPVCNEPLSQQLRTNIPAKNNSP